MALRRRKTTNRASPDLPSTREPPSALVEEALRFPNAWVYEIDGEFGPDDAVPPEAIVGAWTVGPTGVLTGEFIPNPKHRSNRG